MSPTTEWCAEFFVMEGHIVFAMADTFGVVEDFAFEAEQRRYQNMPVMPSPYLQTPLPNPRAGVPEFRLGSHFSCTFCCSPIIFARSVTFYSENPSQLNFLREEKLRNRSVYSGLSVL